jgi:outer membrane biosynthesis protein TonB
MTNGRTEGPDLEPLHTVTDDEMVTERRLARRSFLSSTGVLLAGATGIVSGLQASGLPHLAQDDPDKKPADPDKKPADPDKKPADPDKKPADPDKKPADPDKKPTDPDKKPADPDKKPDDPHRRSF